MRALRCLAAIALLAPGAAGAQTTTADGLQALIRGDYATAVRILRPLAEDTPRPDPLAAFFMATLYHAGHGVAFNAIRACGLYLRAATPTSPFLNQSLALAQTIHQDHPAMLDQCSAASMGTWRDPPAASFTLGRDHWVRIDQAGFVVGYQGTEKAASIPLGGVGWVFLPIRHTHVAVQRPVAVRRHFIEFFMWMPFTVSDHPQWMLWWSVYEIVGADAFDVPIAGVLTTTTATQPPPSFTLEDVVRLQVNGDGEAEYVVGGPNPRRGVIPSTRSR